MSETFKKVTLAHAVKDERGKGTGGTAGDQTEKEVLFQDWYISGQKWDCVLRCYDKKKRAMIADNADMAVRNNHIGYDKGDRYSLYDSVKNKKFNCSSVDKDVECDCSTLATVCANYAGIPIQRDTYTANMKARYTATKEFKVYTANKYTKKSESLKRGDILVRAEHHTAIVANTVWWLKTSLKRSNATVARVNDVKAVQSRLNELEGYGLVIDGDWGSKTEAAVRAFQRKHKLEVDGSVGKITATELGMLYGN